jgi:hypothetical protein
MYRISLSIMCCIFLFVLALKSFLLPWLYDHSWIYIYWCYQCLSPLKDLHIPIQSVPITTMRFTYAYPSGPITTIRFTYAYPSGPITTKIVTDYSFLWPGVFDTSLMFILIKYRFLWYSLGTWVYSRICIVERI